MEYLLEMKIKLLLLMNTSHQYQILIIHLATDQIIWESLSTLCHVYISSQDVTDIIKSLKLNKACGFDLITHTLLKESIGVLSLPLSTLI